MNKTLLLVSILLSAQIGLADEVIPKATLATCKVAKSDLAKWFEPFLSTPSPIEKVVGFITVELKHVNLAGNPGIANFYRISIKGYDKDGKVVQGVHRELDQLAVNYFDNTYSVGYVPYDRSRTQTEPFTLLIQGNSDGSANGTLSVVPMQASSENPFTVIQLGCQIQGQPTEPIQVSAQDVLALPSATQFEILHNLDRLGFVGLKKSERKSLPARTKSMLSKKLAQILHDRPLPKSRIKDATEVVIPNNRCLDVKISDDFVYPIYDSVTYRQGEAKRKGHEVGYKLSSLKCTSPARTTKYKDSEGNISEDTDTWSVRDVTITTDGLIQGYELSNASVNLY